MLPASDRPNLLAGAHPRAATASLWGCIAKPGCDEPAVLPPRPGRTGAFGAAVQGSDLRPPRGDVAQFSFAMGHFVENAGATATVRLLETLRSSSQADASFLRWLTLPVVPG